MKKTYDIIGIENNCVKLCDKTEFESKSYYNLDGLDKEHLDFIKSKINTHRLELVDNNGYKVVNVLWKVKKYGRLNKILYFNNKNVY